MSNIKGFSLFALHCLIKMECSEVKEAWVKKQIVLMIKSFFMTIWVSVQFYLNVVLKDIDSFLSADVIYFYIVRSITFSHFKK